MKTKNIFLVLVILGLFTTSCKKDELQIPEKQSIIPQEESFAKTTNWAYYSSGVPTYHTFWLSPGSFGMSIDNSGDRDAIISVYPRTSSTIDYGNRIDIFTVADGLGYCVLKYYSLPSGYSGIYVEIRKSSPTDGYVSGNLSVF